MTASSVWADVSHKEFATRVSHNSVPQECIQECPTRVSYKSVPQECPTRVSQKSVPQECPTGVSHKSVAEECPTRVSYKSVLQECPTRVSHKSVLQECPTRVTHKSVLQECPTRVSQKSVPQECPTGVSHKSVAEECPTRVSYKSVIWTYVAFRTCLHSGSWAPSCLIFSPRSVQQILLTGKRSHKCRSGTRGKKQRKLRCFACSVAFVWHLKTPKKERNLLVGHNVRLPLLNITLLSNGSLS